jgi:hypothetical protein
MLPGCTWRNIPYLQMVHMHMHGSVQNMTPCLLFTMQTCLALPDHLQAVACVTLATHIVTIILVLYVWQLLADFISYVIC